MFLGNKPLYGRRGFGSSPFMKVGMGLSGISSFSGYYPFSNIMWNGHTWERVSGTGAYTQEWGLLNASVPTDRFRSKLIEYGFNNLPSGTYTVLNPDGLRIGIGAYSDQSYAAFTNATSFTFNYNNAGLICVHVEGSVTNVNGPLQVIMPGQLAAFQSGNPWNPVFLNFIDGLNMNCLRFMDWLTANTSLIQEWSERPTLNSVLFRSKQQRLNGDQGLVAHELIVDLCNRLNIDPWINIPVRASDNYVSNLGAFLAANLNADRKVYFEYGNETWNPGAGFADSRAWVERIDFTKYLADVNYAIDGWTMPNHGLTNGDTIQIYFARENFTITPTINSGMGLNKVVEVLSTDTFRLRDGSLAGAIVVPNQYTVKLLYSKTTEAGKTASVDLNHGATSKRFWDILNTQFPRSRSIHVMGTQLVGAAGTTTRLSPTGVDAATDLVAVAHYYQGDWWVACLDIASGQVIPKAWSQRSGSSIRVAIYTNGSNPTLADVMAGTGAGYIGHRDITISANDADVYTTASAITGLTNGTTYAVRAVLTGQYGDRWVANASVTVSATPSTISFSDSDENMAKRAKRDTIDYLVPYIAAQQAVIGSKPLVAYECGSDYFGGQVPLAEVIAWRSAWTQTEYAADVLDHFYRTMAAKGMTLMNHFVDVGASPGVFNLVESLDDILDPRYIKFSAYNGKIPIVPPVSLANRIAGNVAVEPSYPHVVDTFPDNLLSYSIYNGDDKGNYAISGNQLRIVNGNQINWGVPQARTLIIEGSNGSLTDYFTVSFATGDAWYQSDAFMAWSALVDTDSAAIDPTIGNQLPLLNGVAAVNSGGLLTFTGTNRYGSTTGLSSVIDRTKPFLIAVVIDKNGNNVDSKNHVYTGNAVFVSLRNGTGANNPRLAFGGWAGSGLGDTYTTSGNTPAGKNVHWFYYDGVGNVRVGMNQLENVAAQLGIVFTANMTRELYVGGSSGGASGAAKIGAIQHINRAGMTITDALAIVQKMQTLHGI